MKSRVKSAVACIAGFGHYVIDSIGSSLYFKPAENEMPMGATLVG